MKWVFLTLAIVFEVTATLALRASEGFTKLGYVAVVVVGYAGAFLALNLVLRRGLPIGVAYGIWAAAWASCSSWAASCWSRWGAQPTTASGH